MVWKSSIACRASWDVGYLTGKLSKVGRRSTRGISLRSISRSAGPLNLKAPMEKDYAHTKEQKVDVTEDLEKLMRLDCFKCPNIFG